MPAMPNSNTKTQPLGSPVGWSDGMTKREFFCLMMGVPHTGDEELDAIIKIGTLVTAKNSAISCLSGEDVSDYLHDLDEAIENEEEKLK